MCLVHTQDGIGDTYARVRIVVGDSSDSSYKTGLPITLCVVVSYRSLTSGMLSFLNNEIVTTQSTEVVATTLTSSDGGPLTTVQETPIGSSNWNFCPSPGQVDEPQVAPR